jgi:curli biogenesis system outer membrane secretion channel CsgG
MIRTTTSLIVALTLIGTGSALAQSAPPKPAAAGTKVAPRPAKPAPAAPAVVAPRVVTLDVQKCIGCTTSVRKRLGVMPVKVGVVSAELGLPGEFVGSKVRDALESIVANSGKVLVVNRSELGDVMAEQRLGASGVANADLAPAARAIIPAQILLYTTVDRADVSVNTTKNTNNTAQEYYRQALQKEQQAADVQRTARQEQARFDREPEKGPSFGSAFSEAVDSITTCNTRPTPALVALCEQQKQLNERNRVAAAARARDSRLRSHDREMSRLDDQARTLLTDADMLRRKAEIESRREVTQTKTTTMNIALSWRAVDTSTGAVVASGRATGARTQKEEGVSTQSAFQSSEQTSSTKHDVLVNSALDDAMASLSQDVDRKLAPVPFRAKVAKTDADGVVINAGTNLGVSVGDTFGVREKVDGLTDPDTGELLATPGAPAGYVRVVEVFEKTARAQVVNQAVSVKRGDELEWIGVFVPSGSNGGR